MEDVWMALAAELPDKAQMVRVSVRLLVACSVGALLGAQRERSGQAAGLRTHMLVALGAAVFVLAPLEAGAAIGDSTRAMQGVATGIGFVGAGTILKLTDERRVKGLTTAAGIWLTAALGAAAGCGRLWLPLFGTLLAWFILSILHRLEVMAEKKRDQTGAPPTMD